MKIKIDHFTNINELVSKDSKYTEIYLKKGIYQQKITIEKDGIKLIGEEGVIITNHDHYYKIHEDNKEFNTFRTYTMKVMANNVTIENIHIKNSCTPSNIYGQAVALHVMGNNFLCKDCILESAQDTLFTGPLPENLLIRYKDFLPDNELTGTPSFQHYLNTTIYGDVDFIFGGATAYFEKCKLVCVGKKGFVCAPSHSKDTPYGYLFHNCDIISNSNEQGYYLGRPWRDYGCAAFIDCKLGEHILPVGYDDWMPERQNTCRFYEYTEGIDTSKRAKYSKQLSKTEADKYLNDFIKNFM